MSNVWFTADTHFNHAKVIQFENTTRNFTSIEEHDEKLIENWNRAVRPKDTIWHLGDLYLGKDVEHFHSIMRRLNGQKRLIRGNHDTFPVDAYLEHFDDILGVWPKYGFVMSHVPLHPESARRWGFNVHGHLHSAKVHHWETTYFNDNHDVTESKAFVPDTMYYCVSVEHHNLYPVDLNTIRKALGVDHASLD